MILRQAASFLLWATGVTSLARHFKTQRCRFAITFHGVASRRYPDLPKDIQPSFDAAELRRALTWLRRHFALLSPRQFLAGQPGILLTFDDGFANNFEQAIPVLRELDAPAVFFITTQHVHDPRDWLPATHKQVARKWDDAADVPEEIAQDLYDGMSAEQLRQCAKNPGITIGAHSVKHPLLTQCSDEDLRAELGGSKRTLEEITGKEVDLFAYPTGDYDERVALAVRAAGYRAGFALDALGAGVEGYEIPRIGLYSDRPWYLAAKLSGLHRPGLR